jgi:hypothetical protein
VVRNGKMNDGDADLAAQERNRGMVEGRRVLDPKQETGEEYLEVVNSVMGASRA